jgi:hypothetical protein
MAQRKDLSTSNNQGTELSELKRAPRSGSSSPLISHSVLAPPQNFVLCLFVSLSRYGREDFFTSYDSTTKISSIKQKMRDAINESKQHEPLTEKSAIEIFALGQIYTDEQLVTDIHWRFRDRLSCVIEDLEPRSNSSNKCVIS